MHLVWFQGNFSCFFLLITIQDNCGQLSFFASDVLVLPELITILNDKQAAPRGKLLVFRFLA